MNEHIRSELAGGVLTVTLTRAEKKNAITQAMYAALSDAVERARSDGAVRAVLLKAEGDSFSAVGRFGPRTLPITSNAMPMPVATIRNNRVGKYSAST